MDWPLGVSFFQRALPMLVSSAEDTRKCETTERISAGALGWHPSEYKKPKSMKWRSFRWRDVIWRWCFWLIDQMTKRGCELWPRAPFCVSRFLSRARKEGCVIWSCQGMELCIILWHVVMPPIARGQTWLYQPSPVSTVPNSGGNLSNSNYRGLDEEEEGMGCGKSFCLGGRHRTVDVMNWNVPQFFSNSKWNPHFISANITEERYPLYAYASVFRNNQYALISVRYCIRCMQHHSRIELLMVTWPQRIFRHISAWQRTPQYICIQSWYYIIFPSQNTVWAMATGR